MRTSRVGRLIGRTAAVVALGVAAMGLVGIAAPAADIEGKATLANDYVWQGNPDTTSPTDQTGREEDYTWE